MKKRELRQEYKALEQSYMVLRDDYASLAQALGVPCDAWFGDPLVPHAEVLRTARQCRAQADLSRNIVRKAAAAASEGGE